MARQTPSSSASHHTASLGYANDSSGTRSIMHIVGNEQQPHENLKSNPISNVASRYKALVRQLPSKNCIDRLVQFFFAEISWQYDVVDESSFWEQVLNWERVTYAAQRQPQGLDPELRYFPALLFQVLAQAVLFQPRGDNNLLEDLVTNPGMDLIDLATEFSDAGHQILSILGPTDPALVRVQAGLQRAVFLKATASVVDAWHVLGSTIRDAQELGLHRLYSSSVHGVQPKGKHACFVVTGRRMWLLLHLWDAHMGVVLGRPMVTKLDPGTIPVPQTTTIGGADGTETAQRVVPFDLILCGYHAAYKYLQDIHRLDPWEPEAFAMVDLISATIVNGIEQVPDWARCSDAVHDDQCPWLPAARERLVTEIHFTLLALHRPFMFLRAQNRIEALKAALQVLESQSRLFRRYDPRKVLPFDLVFAIFDAAVIVAAIYILFPSEYPEYLRTSLQCVQWALGRLHAMKAQSTLAARAYAATHEVYQRFLARVSEPYISLVSPSSTATQLLPDQMGFVDSQVRTMSDTPEDLENLLPHSPRHAMIPQDLNNVPSMHCGEGVADNNGVAHPAATHGLLIADLENIPPPLPLHDLIYGSSTNKMPLMDYHNLTAEDNGDAYAATHDFWQVLGALSK